MEGAEQRAEGAERRRGAERSGAAANMSPFLIQVAGPGSRCGRNSQPFGRRRNQITEI